MKKFLILDGNSIINRAFYGIRPLSTKSGIPTNAIYGFLNIIKKHLDAIKPDYIACAFDVHHPTFRHEEYAEYKGTRKGMPDDLRAQMPYAKRAAAALGFLVIECPGFEADDVIGTSVTMAEKTGEIESYILTGDRDSLQLVSDHTTVVLEKTKEDIYFTPTRFFEEYGIKPSQFIDVKALMGDSSDNIPGVPGIGEKTALKLIQAASDLETVYSDVERFGQTKSVIAKLTDGKDSAFMSRRLATILREAPICCMADELFNQREIDSAAFAALCDELEFSGMARKFGVTESATPAEVPAAEVKAVDTDEIASLGGVKFDIPVAISLGEAGFACYTGEGNVKLCRNVAADDVLTFIHENKLICHDYKSLLRTLHITGDGINCEYDTMLAAYLLNPGNGKYHLADTAEKFIGIRPTTLAESVTAIFNIKTETEKQLTEYGMLSLMHDIEIPLSAVLAEMEEIGFKIDPDGIKHYSEELLLTENALMDAIWLQAGRQFNINSPKQLGEVLFDEIGLPSGKKTKTGYSTDAETLESLRPYHTIIEDILMYRKITKLRGTYGDPLIAQADENGRIHTKLNQTGTATGRLASSDPNLQNIPVRDELGRELRKFFIADDGYVLIDADYSQIELRILSALSGDETMQSAFINGQDIHTSVAAQVFGISEDEVTPDLRRRAKAVNFGIVYGIGEFSLAKDLGITRKMAKEYIENYLATYSDVDKYLKDTIASARQDGYTTTYFGRRRNIPELSSKNRNLQAFGERVAMNSPIQGTAADVIKIAMINVNRALKEAKIDARLIMQVHDELIVEAKADCADVAAEILVREMENAVKVAVPLTADFGIGETWYDAK